MKKRLKATTIDENFRTFLASKRSSGVREKTILSYHQAYQAINKHYPIGEMDNYKDLLSDVDLQESFNEDKMITDTVRSVKRGIWIYTIIWFVLLVGLLFILENTSSSPVITTWINDVVSFFHEIEKSGAH